MPYYAVANGRYIGILYNWVDCKNSVKGYKNALYKKFDNEKDAIDFVENNKNNKNIKKFEKNMEFNFDIDFIPDYYVYTDGACSNNGKATASAGIGIFFGVNDYRNVSKKIDGKQTNNIAELTAIIETYHIIEKDVMDGKKIAIVSDSEYAIKCVSSYGEKCSKKCWNIDIPNKELVKKAYDMYKDKTNVIFIHINSHTNNTDIHSLGNAYADKLANMSL